MYRVKKRLEVSAAHQLKLDYPSKGTQIHGHNWIIDVYLESETVDSNGMVLDFTKIKELVKDKLDHKILNDVLDFNPTAENIAYWICSQFPCCYREDVQESENNVASYNKDQK